MDVILRKLLRHSVYCGGLGISDPTAAIVCNHRTLEESYRDLVTYLMEGENIHYIGNKA